MRRAAAVAALVALAATGCGGGDDPEPQSDRRPDRTSATAPPDPAPTAPAAQASTRPTPGWLGERPLPRRPDGYGEVRPTPGELDPRHLATVDVLEPPAGSAFESTVEPVPEDVLARSTWSPACPVGVDDLRYVRVSFWGFDDEAHTGELLVSSDVAGDVVEVFGSLFEARFPIEEMRITRAAELDLAPTGDGNNTGAFVCRPVTGSSTSWSEHAYGRAVDVNPFHNPYVRGDLVLPELASSYADREEERPGMIAAGGVVERAFEAVGWGWGGGWARSKDWMHFSVTGR